MYYCNSRYYDPNICRWISIDEISYLDSDDINCINLWCYCGNNPINCCDYSGFLVLAAIGISTAIYYAIVFLIAVTVVATMAYIENETHVIEKCFTELENLIIDVEEYISVKINDLFESITSKLNSITESIMGSSTNTISSYDEGHIYDFENVYYYKRKKAAPRIKCKSKKEAKEKAFLKGGKRPPKHHPNGKYGPHYHPDDPRFSHWHYYYLGMILFEIDENAEW